MGEARRRAVNGNGLLIPDTTLVAPNGAPLLSPGTAAQAAAPKHYGVVLLENGRTVRQSAAPHPFVRVAVAVKGWKKAWAVLRGRYTVEVHVHGDEQAMRDVFGPGALIRP